MGDRPAATVAGALDYAVVTGRRQAITAAVLFLACLGLYVATAAPGLTWRNEGGDGGDFLTAAFTWGVPHPTGYPAYVLGLRLFSWLVPVGEEAYRGNLFSAFCAAAAVPFVFLAALATVARLPEALSVGRRGPYAVALFAAVAFAVSGVFWSQAVITEVYALNALFTAVLLWLALRARDGIDRGQPVWGWLTVAGLLLGLGLGNHVMLGFVAAPLAVWVYAPAVRRRSLTGVALWRPAVALIAGLSVYAYAPIASAQLPVLNWGHPHTLEGFRWMVSGSIYQRYAFGVEGQYLGGRVLKVLDFLQRQYGIVGLVLGVAGLATLWSRSRGFALAGAAAAVLVAAYAVGYAPADSYVYLIPVFMVFALWMGAGLAALASTLQELAGAGRVAWLTRHRARVLPAVLVLAVLSGPAYLLPLNYRDVGLRGETEARDYARGALAVVEPGAIIFGDGDGTTRAQVFGLWYQAFVAEPEKRVLVVSPALLQYDWYWDDLRRQSPEQMPDNMPATSLERVIAIAAWNEGRSAVYLTHDNRFYSPSFSLIPAGELFRVAGIARRGGA